MIVKPDWKKFEYNFSDNPQANFEWMCYLLFCREFKKNQGIKRYINQPAIETEPVEYEGKISGFQAKFYQVNLSAKKTEIEKTINNAAEKYPNLTTLYFYSNKDWTDNSRTSSTNPEVKKTIAEQEIEEYAKSKKIEIIFRTASYFESPDFTKENSDIAYRFFEFDTNKYLKRIHNITLLEIEIPESEMYESCLYLEENNTNLNIGKKVLSKFLIEQLRSKDIKDFPDIFLKGVSGQGKSTEMKMAYIELVRLCSKTEYLSKFQLWPMPYFYELKNYREGCIKIGKEECPILFLDGLDEIPSSKIIPLEKELLNLKSQNPTVRFIISGRYASFPFGDINHVDIELKAYIDSDLRDLIYRYKGTYLESFVTIPFYRKILSSNSFIRKTYKEVIDKLIISKLKGEKDKSDRSNDISCPKNGLNLDEIIQILADLSYKLFKSERRVFNKAELSSCFNNDDYVYFVQNSCIVDYKTENDITFFSNIYFEYFLAKYYEKKSWRTIKQDFFISTGTVKVQYINILTILLNIIDSKTKLYQEITEFLNQKTSAYVLLTDYLRLEESKRFVFYKKIIEEYNNDDKIIRYGVLGESNTLLKNIYSLSDSLHILLPEKFYNDAVKNHCDTIQDFLKKPMIENIISFENSVILLGVYRKFWNKNQEGYLKKIAFPLIHFFVTDNFAKKMRGLLSEDIVFRWYEDYNWTENWGEKDWIAFVRKITGKETPNLYNFESETDFKLMLKLFVHFHKNKCIEKLIVPLTEHCLKSKKIDVGSSVSVPQELDDEFKIPVLHFDNDIYYFTEKIKEHEISLIDLLNILNSCASYYIGKNLPYQIDKLYEEISRQFKERIGNLTDKETKSFYQLLKTYIDNKSGIYLLYFCDCITLLNDDQKIKVFGFIEKDLQNNNSWQTLWTFEETLVKLLDVNNFEKAKQLFEKLKVYDSLYKGCLAEIHNNKELHGHILFEFACSEYNSLFSEQIQKKEKHNNILSQFAIEKEKMFENEFYVITSKKKLREEVRKIIDYLGNKNLFSENLFQLKTSSIQDRIKYDYDEKYSIPPVFSDFAIHYLSIFTGDNGSLDTDRTFQDIDGCFSDEKIFWRYFFWRYIDYYGEKETCELLKLHPELTEKIKESMQQDVASLIEKENIDSYDGARNKPWVEPFIYYVIKLYSNKLPEWFDKDKIVNFIVYPELEINNKYILNSIENNISHSYNKIFKWVQVVSGISESVLIEKSISFFPELKSDFSKSQLISVFSEKLKYESDYERQMIDIIINETCKELKKDPKEHTFLNNVVLSSFWGETKENLIDRFNINISEICVKYNPEDFNHCRRNFLEYICRIATKEQKGHIIASLKSRIDNDNIKTFLVKLGYQKAIIKCINEFLKGAKLNPSLLANADIPDKSIFLLIKFCQLYKYCLEQDSERRRRLSEFAQKGIIRTSTKCNFWIVKIILGHIIKKLRRKHLYFGNVEMFLNDLEQRLYGGYKE